MAMRSSVITTILVWVEVLIIRSVHWFKVSLWLVWFSFQLPRIVVKLRHSTSIMLITQLCCANEVSLSSSFKQVCFMTYTCYRKVNDVNVCVYVYEICEKFGGSMRSFSWLGKKVKITQCPVL